MDEKDFRNCITSLLMVGTLAFATFIVSRPSLSVFFVIYDFLLGAIMSTYYKCENYKFLKRVLIFSLFIVAVYFLARVTMRDIVSYEILGRSWMTYISFTIYVTIVILLLVGIYNFPKNLKTKNNHIDYTSTDSKIHDWFFKRREYDLKRLESYMTKSEIVGINGGWGTGKTVLTQEFKNRHKDEIYSITVDILTCNENELELFLTGEIEKLLIEHHIYSRNAKLLKDIMSQQSLMKELRQLIWENDDSKVITIDAYKEDIKKLDRPVIISIEDLDRLCDEKIIKKLLDFTNRMVCPEVRFIYEYDSERLKKCGIDRDYIEKYVPYVVNLSPISFDDAVKYYEKELGIDSKDYHFLTNPVYSEQFIVKNFGMNYEMKMEYFNSSLRKVKTFLEESKLYKNNQNVNYNYNKNKKTIITFLFMKHFWSDIYEELDFKSGCLTEMKFVSPDTGNSYNMLELLEGLNNEKITPKEVQEMFRGESDNDKDKAEIQARNRIKYVMLCCSGYVFRPMYEKYLRKKEINEEHSISFGKSKRYDENYNAPLYRLRAEFNNDKIDRLINNLHAKGLSENTNYEENAKIFIDDVLYADDLNEALGKFLSYTYQSNYDRDNNTIFKYGIDTDLELAKALELHMYYTDEISDEKKEDIWIKFLNFRNNEYKLQVNNSNAISVEYISFCKHIDISYRQVFIRQIQCFNEMEIVGNLGKEKIYIEFLKMYFQRMIWHGYIDYEHWDRIEWIEAYSDSIDYIKKYLKEFSEEVDKMIANDLLGKTAVDELSDIKRFAEKNIEILECEKQLQRKEISIHSKEESEPHYTDKDTYQHMEQLTKTDINRETFKAELDFNYKQGRLSVEEIKRLGKLYKHGRDTDILDSTEEIKQNT